MRILFFVVVLQSLSDHAPERMSTDSYHWGALGISARSVIRIVIAPIIIGLCKPALSVVISPDCSRAARSMSSTDADVSCH